MKVKIICNSFKISDNSKKDRKDKKKNPPEELQKSSLSSPGFFLKKAAWKSKVSLPSLTEMPSPWCHLHRIWNQGPPSR
jgi:hypothetical protein